MSEHQPSPGEPGRAEPDDAAEAELIRKVLRTQERHREGGVDPELDEDAAASEAGQASDGEASGGEASGGGTDETEHSGG